MSVQSLLERFYSIDNLVAIDISIPDQDWTKLSTTQGKWGWRADASAQQIQNEHHYDWFKATSISISGAKFPSQKTTFNGVAIIKKSFAGSELDVKPSIKLDFSRAKTSTGELNKQDVKKNEAAVQALIGGVHLTLNNCKQDDAYIRQPLGYEIFRQGGIPYARCNFAKVTVNNKSLGIYVNLEPIQDPYLQRNFAGNDKGNLYETEWRFDLDSDNFKNGKYYNQEGFSPYKDQKDLILAVSQIEKDMQAAKQVVDIPQVTRVLAMQAVVKHWDGYPNNTFVYNDKVAVQEPKLENGNVKLKIIPSGIDAIFVDRPFQVKSEGVLSQLVLNDNEANAQLKATLQECSKTFEKNLDGNLKLIDKMADLIKNANASDPWKTANKVDVPKAIAFVKDQLKGVKAGVASMSI